MRKTSAQMISVFPMEVQLSITGMGRRFGQRGLQDRGTNLQRLAREGNKLSHLARGLRQIEARARELYLSADATELARKILHAVLTPPKEELEALLAAFERWAKGLCVPRPLLKAA